MTVNVISSIEGRIGLLELRRDWVILLPIVVLWLLLILLVNPTGDFPLLDDGSYGRSVKILVEEGRLAFDEWISASLFLQVLYGALFVLPSGFSFETLRVSTLVAGLAGGLGTYALLLQVGACRFLGAVGCLTILLNPGYFQHSFSFMTDIPLTALAVWSAAFFVRALRTESTRDLVPATILAACAVLVRQPGLAVPLAYGVALLGTRRPNAQLWMRAATPFIVSAGVLWLFNASMGAVLGTHAAGGGFPEVVRARLAAEELGAIALDTIRLNEALFAHSALALLPFLLFILTHTDQALWAPFTRKRVLLGSVVTIAVLLSWRFWPSDLPVRIFGTMQIIMHGPRPWAGADEPIWFRQVVWVAEFIATVLMMALLAAGAFKRVGRQGEERPREFAPALFGFLAAAAFVAPFALAGGFNERYLIPVLPFVLIAVVAWVGPQSTLKATRGWAWALPAGAVTLAAYGALSLMFAHDYLLWNRKTWDAVEWLIKERQVEPSRIDGGLGVNLWYLYPHDAALRTRYLNLRAVGSGWWVHQHADYVIGFHRGDEMPAVYGKKDAPAPQASGVIWRRNFDGWLPEGDGAIVVCRQPGCAAVFDQRRRQAGRANAAEHP